MLVTVRREGWRLSGRFVVSEEGEGIGKTFDDYPWLLVLSAFLRECERLLNGVGRSWRPGLLLARDPRCCTQPFGVASGIE